MKLNNTLFNPSITVLKKVNFTELSLDFPKGFDAITAEEHKELWPLLLQCNKSSQWWLGDYLANCEHEVTDPKSGKITKAMKVKLYEYVEDTTGHSRQYLRELKSIAKRIPKDKRTSLSFRHHRDAITCANGDPEIAFASLAEAEKDNLSLSKMRTGIRTLVAGSGAIRTTIDSTPADSDFAELVTLLQKIKTIINKNNITDDQKAVVLDEIDTIGNLLSR